MPSWSDPENGTTSAILIEDSGISVVEFGTGKDFADVARRAVGDPLVEQVTYLYRVNLWVGDNSRSTSRLNPLATQIAYDLFRDVRDGRYVATDRERANASRLVADPDGALVFHGPLLITGAHESGSPGPFDENFRDWFSQGRGGITQIRDSIRTSVAMLLGIHASNVAVTGPR